MPGLSMAAEACGCPFCGRGQHCWSLALFTATHPEKWTAETSAWGEACAGAASAATNIDREEQVVGIPVGNLSSCHLSHPIPAICVHALCLMRTFGGSLPGKNSPAFSPIDEEFAVQHRSSAVASRSRTPPPSERRTTPAKPCFARHRQQRMTSIPTSIPTWRMTYRIVERVKQNVGFWCRQENVVMGDFQTLSGRS
jgi:hypothetical protein